MGKGGAMKRRCKACLPRKATCWAKEAGAELIGSQAYAEPVFEAGSARATIRCAAPRLRCALRSQFFASIPMLTLAHIRRGTWRLTLVAGGSMTSKCQSALVGPKALLNPPRAANGPRVLNAASSAT